MRLKYTFEKMEIDEHIIAIPVGDSSPQINGVVKLNKTADFIFELLKDDISEDEIVDALMKEFDAPKELLKRDVQRYLADFQEKGMLC